MNSPHPPPLSIVIPTYGNWWLIQRCLESLDRHGLPGQQVIVVDDGSRDETRARLAERKGLEVLFAGKNQGFAAGCNMGATLAASEKILFLNADTEVRAGALQALLRALEDESVGAVGARLLYPDGTIQHAGVYVDHGAMPSHVHWFRPGELSDALVARDYPAVTGAVLLMRTAEFRGLGGFDEGYRNGFEDVDLCLSVWQSGKRVRYEPAAEFLHLESVSEGRHTHEEANARRLVARWRRTLTGLARPSPAPVQMTALPPLYRGALGDDGRRLLHALSGKIPDSTPVDVDGIETAVGGLYRSSDRVEIAFVSPADAAEARAIEERIAAPWYVVPTLAARALMVGAGVALDRVDVWRWGADSTPSMRDGDAIVFYVSDVTSVKALETAIETWASVRATLEPRGAQFRLHIACSAARWRELLAAVLEALGVPSLPPDVETVTLGPAVTEPDALRGARTVLAVGATDRVGRIPLLALAGGIDLIALGDVNLDGLRDRDVARVTQDARELPDLLIASFAESRSRRADRLDHAAREVRRVYGEGRMKLAGRFLLRRFVDLHPHRDDAMTDERLLRAGFPRPRRTSDAVYEAARS